MRLADKWHLLRSFPVFIYTLGLSLYLLICQRTPVPDAALTNWLNTASTGVAFLMALHLIRGVPALPLLFGRKGTQKWIFWRVIWTAMTGLALLSTIPSLAKYCFPLLFSLYASSFIRARLYSIENILFQSALFHLSLAQCASWFQAYLRDDALNRVKSTALFALFLSLALMMHSAGFEKLKSPVWRQGEGTLRFLNLRHLIRSFFRDLPVQLPKSILVMLSHAVMAAELGLLPAMVFRPALPVVLLVLGGFSVSLFLVTDISFIGQLLCLQLTVMGWSFAQGFGQIREPLLQIQWHGEDIIFAASALLTCVAIHLPELSRKLKLSFMQHLASGINSPLWVFTETHLNDLLLYRFRILSDGQIVPLNQVFDEDGSPGAAQRWRPRYLQSAMYLIGRLVRKHSKEGVLSSAEVETLLDLMACAMPHRMDTKIVRIELFISHACREPNDITRWFRFAEGQFSPENNGTLTFDKECLNLNKPS